jgi:hypothetical protein
MQALALALGQGSEKSLIKVDYFYGDGKQDPEEWLEEFRRAATANKWSAARKLELVPVYLKSVALDWYRSLNPRPTHFSNANNPQNSFKRLFRDCFHTTKQKAVWQKQMFEIKQGADSVDAYINRFKALLKRVDPGNAFPADFLKQLFIQGLKTEYSINVQAAEPATLNDAAMAARRWETGHVMANTSNNETDQAIRQLTDQIAQLSINLAQKQTPSVNYANAEDTEAPRIKQPPTCHYCGRTGHFIAHCRVKSDDENRSRRHDRDSRNNRDNAYRRNNIDIYASGDV